MKDKLIKILLILVIIIHAASPIVELAVWGYDILALLKDIYSNGVIVILSAAVLRLYHSKNDSE